MSTCRHFFSTSDIVERWGREKRRATSVLLSSCCAACHGRQVLIALVPGLYPHLSLLLAEKPRDGPMLVHLPVETDVYIFKHLTLICRLDIVTAMMIAIAVERVARDARILLNHHASINDIALYFTWVALLDSPKVQPINTSL